MNDKQRKAMWAKYKPKEIKVERSQKGSGIKCQHCGSNNAENSKLRGMTLCGSCKNNVWKSDTAGSNYDRFIGMGSSHEDALLDSGYRF